MIKINQLEIENVKRIKAVKIKPSKEGLTIVGGRNNQGKTSVLDAIAWALGGDKYRPSQAARDGAMVPPNLHIVLSNGIVVERRGVNSALKVIDPDGKKGGQQLLNSFVEQLAQELAIPREEVVLAMDAIVDPVSLYEPIYSEGGDTVCVMDQVSDRRCTDESWIQRIALKDAISRLTPRERSILMMRFNQGKTQMEVSAQIGISQAQVSRLEKGAIRAIKKEL